MGSRSSDRSQRSVDGQTAGAPIKEDGAPRPRCGPLQLDGRVRQPWPLCGFSTTQWHAFERAIERLLPGQQEVDGARQFLRDDRKGDRLRLPARQLLIELLDLREVLDDPDGGVMKRELEVPVAILRPSAAPAMAPVSVKRPPSLRYGRLAVPLTPTKMSLAWSASARSRNCGAAIARRFGIS